MTDEQHILLMDAKIVTCESTALSSSRGGEQPSLCHYSWMVFTVHKNGNNEEEEKEGIIVDVGGQADVRRLDEWKPRVQRIISANQKLVLPGLWDAHCHAYSMGHVATKVVSLAGCKSIADFQERLRAKLMEQQQDSSSPLDTNYLQGVQWDQEELSRYPNRFDLDAISTTIPIICIRRCWHVAVANTRALEVCGLYPTFSPHPEHPHWVADHQKDTSPTDFPIGVQRDPSNNNLPTGILQEDAMQLLRPLTNREETFDDKKLILKSAMKIFNQHGVTAIQTNDTKTLTNISNAYQVYQDILAERIQASSNPPLPCRVFLTTEWQALTPSTNDTTLTRSTLSAPRHSSHSTFLRSDRTKLVMDGALGPSTAALTRPYEHSNSKGLLLLEPDQLETALERAFRCGYRVEAHAIGDRAFEVLLRGLEQFPRHPRPVVTHCQIGNTNLLEQLKQYHSSAVGDPIIANIQPQFNTSDSSIVVERLGTDRIEFAYNWATLTEEGGCLLAGGSDAPVEEPNALLGMANAMSNKIHSSGNQDLSFAQALAMYTVNAAYAANMEHSMGRIAPGFAADFVITNFSSVDEISMASPQWGNHILETFVSGVSVYKHDMLCQPIFTPIGPNGPGKSGRPLWQCPCCS